MILNGVIRKYPKVRLSDFYGGISYTASKLKNNPGRDPNPGGGDIRRAIAEYCILPMCKFLNKNDLSTNSTNSTYTSKFGFAILISKFNFLFNLIFL